MKLFINSAVANFICRGSRLALTMFAQGLIATCFITALDGSSHAVFAYGLSWTIISVALGIATGFQLLVLSYYSRHHAGLKKGFYKKVEILLYLFVVPALIFGVLMMVILGAIGLWIERYMHFETALFFHYYYWLRISVIGLAPLIAVLSGFLIIEKQDTKLLYLTLIHLVISVTSVMLISLWIKDPGPKLSLFATLSSVYDILFILCSYRLLKSGRQLTKPLLLRFFDTAISWKIWKKHFQQISRASAGSLDVVVILLTFNCVMMLAAKMNTEYAALTSTLIAFIRTFVIPLKSYGIIAGKLASCEANNRKELIYKIYEYSGVMVGIFLALGITMILWPEILARMLPHTGIERDTFRLLIRLIGVQFLLEPFAGFLSALLKVVVKPSASLMALIISLWGLALPLLMTLYSLNILTIGGMWTTLVGARFLFAVQNIYLFYEFKRSLYKKDFVSLNNNYKLGRR